MGPWLPGAAPRNSSPRALLRALLLTLTALWLAGCSYAETPPNLLNVLEVTPRQLEVGDRLEVIGTGFPEGRVGTVTFRGQLHRPGQRPETAFITARAGSVSQNRIALELTEELEERLCGSGAAALHTTFRGQVVVAFSPRQAGAPPVTGMLDQVVIDVAPPVGKDTVEADLRGRGERTLEYLGLALAPGSGRLLFSAVLPGSRAERGGLLAKDQLLEFNGVVVRDVRDLVPPPGQRSVVVAVRRGRLKEPVVRVVDIDGLVPVAPRELALAAMLVGFLTGIMLLFVAPVAELITWAERRIAGRLRDSVGTSSRGPQTWAAWLRHAARRVADERMLPAARGLGALRVVPYLQFLGVSAAFTLLAFGYPLVAEDLDLPLALLASLTALLAIGLMLGGWRPARGWSLFAGLRRALLVFAFQLPVVAVVAVVLLTTGSARAADLVHAQGALPWQWQVYTNPLLLVGLGVVLATQVPESGLVNLDLPEADPPPGAERTLNPGLRCLMVLAEWGHVFVLAGILSLLLLGGWNVPGVAPDAQAASLKWQVVGAVLVQVKCWSLVLVVRGVRWVLPRIDIEHMVESYFRWLAPLTLGVVGLTLAWSWGLALDFRGAVTQGVSIVLFALTAFVAAYLAFRVFLNLRGSASQLNVNPWL